MNYENTQPYTVKIGTFEKKQDFDITIIGCSSYRPGYHQPDILYYGESLSRVFNNESFVLLPLDNNCFIMVSWFKGIDIYTKVGEVLELAVVGKGMSSQVGINLTRNYNKSVDREFVISHAYSEGAYSYLISTGKTRKDVFGVTLDYYETGGGICSLDYLFSSGLGTVTFGDFKLKQIIEYSYPYDKVILLNTKDRIEKSSMIDYAVAMRLGSIILVNNLIKHTGVVQHYNYNNHDNRVSSITILPYELVDFKRGRPFMSEKIYIKEKEIQNPSNFWISVDGKVLSASRRGPALSEIIRQIGLDNTTDNVDDIERIIAKFNENGAKEMKERDMKERERLVFDLNSIKNKMEQLRVEITLKEESIKNFIPLPLMILPSPENADQAGRVSLLEDLIKVEENKYILRGDE